jgi:hypothetical protein
MRDPKIYHLAQRLTLELCLLDFPNIWRIKPYTGAWYEIIYTRDAFLMLHTHANNRAFIGATTPREMTRASNADSITVSLDRDPEAIARDVMHRLLPNARAHFATSRAYTRKEKDKKEQLNILLSRLKPFETWRNVHADNHRAQWYGKNDTRAEIYAERIDLRIDNLNLESALKILKLLEIK